jgi:DNA modification methylase
VPVSASTTTTNAAAAKRLSELERVVDRGLQSTLRVACALREIRSKRLYRTTRHATFEAYVYARFGLGRSQAYNLLKAAEVMDALSTTVDAARLPKNEQQARALRPLLAEGEKALQKFWRDWTSNHPDDFTGDAIKQAVRKRQAKAAPQLIKLPSRAESRVGGVYKLGPHRLLCGDAADVTQLTKFLSGVSIDVLWTDPPYGVDYGRKIEGDQSAGLLKRLTSFFLAIDRQLGPKTPFYICSPAGSQGTEFCLALRTVNWHHHETLVWKKQAFVMGRSDYHFQHEPILYGWTSGPGDARRISGTADCRWLGGDNESTIFEVDRPTVSRAHPMMKPPELIEKMLQNSCPPDGAVLDPFAGSGSTLEACHRLGMRAFLVEKDPRYCDVIRDRWKKLQ